MEMVGACGDPLVCGQDEGENCWQRLLRQQRPLRDGDGGGGGDQFHYGDARALQWRPTMMHHRHRHPIQRA